MTEKLIGDDPLSELKEAADKLTAAVVEINRIMNDLRKNVTEEYSIANEARNAINGPPSQELVDHLRTVQWLAVESCRSHYQRAWVLAVEQDAIAQTNFREVSRLCRELTQRHEQEIRQVLNLDSGEIAERMKLAPVTSICKSIEGRCNDGMLHIQKLASAVRQIDKEITSKREELLRRWRELV